MSWSPPPELNMTPMDAPIVIVKKTAERKAICPRCRREMTLQRGNRIPDDGWSWLWWACICGAVTAPCPVRLKDRT